MDNSVSHGIKPQLDDGMKPEFAQDILTLPKRPPRNDCGILLTRANSVEVPYSLGQSTAHLGREILLLVHTIFWVYVVSLAALLEDDLNLLSEMFCLSTNLSRESCGAHKPKKG